jgi:hypothetical protein
MPLGAVFAYPAETMAAYTISATVLDSRGHCFALPHRTITIGGARPIIDSLIMVDSMDLGAFLSVRLMMLDRDSSSFKLRVISDRRYGDSTAFMRFEGAPVVTLSRRIIDTGWVHFSITLIDSSGFSVNRRDSAYIRYVLPTVHFPSETLQINQVDAAPVSVQSAGCSLFVWSVDNMIDTTAVGGFTVSYTDSLLHVLRVYGIDRFGYRGATDSVVIQAHAYGYRLMTDTTKFTLGAKDTVVWWLAVDDAARARRDGIRYVWTLPADTGFILRRSARGDTLCVYFSDSAHFGVSAYAVDSAGGRSGDLSASVTVHRYSPFLRFSTRDTVIARPREIVPLSVHAVDSMSGAIASINFHRAGKNGRDTTAAAGDSIWRISSASTDTFDVTAHAVDNDGFPSNPDSVRVEVRDLRPYFTADSMADTTVFINDTVLLHADPMTRDSRYAISEILWRFGDTTAPVTRQNSADTIRHVFTSAGICTVTVRCKDAFGDTSLIDDAIHVTVLRAAPRVESFGPDTVYVYSDLAGAIGWFDTNGTVQNLSVAWGSAAPAVIPVTSGGHRNTTTVHHTFTGIGDCDSVITITATDDDGIASPPFQDTIRVLHGGPAFASVTIDTAPGMVFIADNRRYSVTCTDPNGTIDSIRVSWNGDTVFEARQRAVAGADTFSHTFAITDSGTATIRFRASDNHGFTHDTLFTLQVRSGAPRIDSLRIDTTGANLFVRDTRKYRVHASDVNGKITRLYAAWDSGTVAADSITLSTPMPSIDTAFTHAYDTALAGRRLVRFWARDDDGVYSARKDSAITAHKAPPLVYADKADTAWVIVDNGAGKSYPIHINHSDTNGNVIAFFWNEADSSLAHRTATDTIMRNIGILEVNHGWPMWIYGRDDDSLTRGGRFTVFADSAPRAITASYSDATGKFSWSGLDAKDSLATEFRILVKKGSQPDTSANSPDTAKDWTRADDPAFNYNAALPKPFSWTFTPANCASGQTCTYFYQIVSRDSRGTKSMGQYSSGNFDYAQP